MTPKSSEDVRGIEYDWLAIDVENHVALFTTAGGGYTPDEFLRDTDAHDAAIEAILALPVRTTALFVPTLPAGKQNTWKRMAERGLFAFDADANGGPYRRVAAPQSPVRIDDLPEEVVAVVLDLKSRDLRFARLTEVTASALADRDS